MYVTCTNPCRAHVQSGDGQPFQDLVLVRADQEGNFIASPVAQYSGTEQMGLIHPIGSNEPNTGHISI